MRHLFPVLVAASLLNPLVGLAAPPAPAAGPVAARNVVFLVADGMGLANVTGARIFRHGPDGPGLSFESLEQVGYQRTHAADSAVTDSAAAASAWACGEKFRNGEICQHGVGGAHPESVLERARARGKAAGLVATSTVTHATPAAFAAHVHSRDCETEIARQYLMETRVEVILGGGLGPDRAGRGCPGTADPEGRGRDPGHLVSWARSAGGYTHVSTVAELEGAVASGAPRLLGLFAPGALTPEHRRAEDSSEPRLADLTRAALDLLEEDPDGFFLVVEGSQVDWANHANDPEYQRAELLAFDDAVEVVLGWVAAEPGRGSETLVIVTSDHDTGGFAITGPAGSLPRRGGRLESAWISRGHTGVDSLVWSQGPGSGELGGALDNTDLYGAILRAMGGGTAGKREPGGAPVRR